MSIRDVAKGSRLFAAILLALVATDAGIAQEAREPQVSCSFEGDEEIDKNGDRFLVASNLNLIEFLAWVEPRGQSVARAVIDDGRLEEQSSVKVLVRDRKSGDLVSSKTYRTGNRVTKSGFAASAGQLEISVDDSWREAQTDQFFDQELSKPEYAGQSPAAKAMYRQVMKMFLPNAYRENKAGEYEVACRYTSEGDGVWQGTSESAPVLIRVKYNGNYLRRHYRPR